MTISLYAELIAAGVEIANHESDLYYPVTPETTAILQRHPLERQCTTTFIHQLHGQRWYDTAFAYVPWWESRLKEQSYEE